LHDEEDMPNNVTFFQGTTCSLYCPSLNGSTVLGTWERTFSPMSTFGGLEWIVATSTQVSGDIQHRSLTVNNTCNYTIACCSTQSQYNCFNVTGIVSATGNNGTLCNTVDSGSDWNCTLRKPPCPLVPLPPSPCSTLGIMINSPSITPCFVNSTCPVFGIENNAHDHKHFPLKLKQVNCAVNRVFGFQVRYIIINNSTGPIPVNVVVTNFSAVTVGTNTPGLVAFDAGSVGSKGGAMWVCNTRKKEERKGEEIEGETREEIEGETEQPTREEIEGETEQPTREQTVQPFPCVYSGELLAGDTTAELYINYKYMGGDGTNDPTLLMFFLTAQGTTTVGTFSTVITSNARSEPCDNSKTI